MKFIKRLNHRQVLLEDVHGLDEQDLFELGYEYTANTDLKGRDADGEYELWTRVDLEDIGIFPEV